MGDPAVIADSWRRSTVYGLDPGLSLIGLTAREVDPWCPLMAAAGPVLDEFADSLAGSGFAFILGDRAARVLHRFGDTRAVNRALDERCVLDGVSFAESTVGTNALGTALELRRPVMIEGEDHFVDQLKAFTCLGRPIIHPLTKRVAGVLDLTGTAAIAHPAVEAMMGHFVRGIESRLLDASRLDERALMDAFQTAAHDRDVPVVALGEDVVHANRRALDLLDGDDFAVLRSLGPGVRGLAGARRVDVDLTAGRVGIELAPAPGGAILRLLPPSPWSRGESSATGGRFGRASSAISVVETHVGQPAVLVTGPPGSGRTTRALEVADGDRSILVDGQCALLDGRAWARQVDAARRHGEDVLVCLDNIDLVPEHLLAVAIDLIKEPRGPRVVMVTDSLSTTSNPSGGRATTLLSMCGQRILMPPLNERLDELHLIAVRMLQDIRPGIAVRLTPSVMEALAAHHWPGNLNELRTVMLQVAARRATGDVALTDLPEEYRSRVSSRRLGGLERAESDAIRRALALYDGNKSKAAEELGISRTTLYARMKQLRIAG